MEILEKTLRSMRPEFTSHQFNDLARLNGVTENEIEGGITLAFLKRATIQTGKRRWQKMTTDLNDKIQSAIDFLKANGFKIQKRTEKWEDV